MDKIQANIRSTLKFNNYIIDYINYSTNPNFQSADELDIKMSLETETKIDESQSKGQVTIIARFFEEREGNYPFNLDLSITGFFSMTNSQNFDIKDLYKRVKINGTTALFPFLRSVVADITKTANMQPLIMPLINIHKLIEQQEQVSDTDINV